MEEDLKQVEIEVEESPLSLDEVISNLRGFGIEEFEQILSIKVGGRLVKLRIANIPTQDEMSSLLAAEEYKGYTWVQRIKCEILSRAITWINGKTLRTLAGKERLVTDPTDGMQKDIQVVLRNILMGWGIEVVAILWKVLMVHAQKIEDKLLNDFPDSAIMTDVEKRLISLAIKEIDEASHTIIQETVADLYKSEGVELPTESTDTGPKV